MTSLCGALYFVQTKLFRNNNKANSALLVIYIYIFYQIGSWIKQTDRNGDGKLSQKEFMKSIHAFSNNNTA